MCKVIYEDNHLLVVEKPPGLLTQGDATGDICLVEKMKQYIAQKYEKPGAVYLGLVHRMDRPVGGLVALARTGKAAARLSEQLRAHLMEREYLAVTHGCDLPGEGELRNFLLKDAKSGNVQVVAEHREGAQEAILRFAVLSRHESSDTALLHIRLKTGRKHQIRVQLAGSGHPIVQDMRYGKGKPGEPIALWGGVLRFQHPTQKKEMVFCSHPQGRLFDPFSQELNEFFAEASQGGRP